MLASLTVSSDRRLLSLVRALGREFAAALGLAEQEGARLAGTLDVAVRFVCDHAYPDDPTGRVDVTLEPADRGVRVAVHDWGRPLISAEGARVGAGLGAGIEDLRLINLGAQGKRLSFVWSASHAIAVTADATDAPPPVVAPIGADAITVRDARPDDAERIAQLLYENYALSYVHPDFYRPRWLRAELQAGHVLASVAVHGSDIVGHHALMPPPHPPPGETGVAVVAPAYRGLGIFGRLGEHTLARARAAGLPAVYGRAVTVHPFSQRAELAHGYRETAVCLAGSPAGAASDRRTALIVSFLPLRPAPRRATLPERYRDRLLQTYAGLGVPAPEPAGDGARSPGAIAVTRVIDSAAAVLTIRGWDDELAQQAIAAIRALLAEHVDVIYADVDLEATADPDGAVAALRGQGFSYAGLWLHGPGDHDHLRLQRLNCTAVELDAIATASPAGEDLVRFVLADL